LLLLRRRRLGNRRKRPRLKLAERNGQRQNQRDDRVKQKASGEPGDGASGGAERCANLLPVSLE